MLHIITMCLLVVIKKEQVNFFFLQKHHVPVEVNFLSNRKGFWIYAF